MSVNLYSDIEARERVQMRFVYAALYTLAAITIMVGLTGLLWLTQSGADAFNYAIATATGVAIAASTAANLRLGTRVAVAIVIVLTSVPITENPSDNAVTGYSVAIVLAGVVLARRIIPLVCAASLACYAAACAVYAAQYHTLDFLGGTIAVILPVSLVAGLTYTFSTIYHNAALRAEGRAEELAGALAQLETRLSLEQEIAAQVEAVTHELAAVAEQQSGTAVEQATAAQQVTATIEELAQAAAAIAASAREVSVAAVGASVAAGRSQDAVSAASEAMLRIKLQVQAIVERTIALNGRVSSIAEVNQVIASVAAQIHLLALNAAVEAATAGAGPHGFAVVASNFKKLAVSTGEEAMRVRGIVTEAQHANAASVMATEQGLKDADKGVAAAALARDANYEVLAAVSQTSAQAEAIRMATSQQRTASEQAVDTMRQLGDGAQLVAQSARQIEAAVNELSALVAQLGRVSAENGAAENGGNIPAGTSVANIRLVA